MKIFFTGFFLGVFLTVATGWYFAVGRKKESVQNAQVAVAQHIEHAVDALSAKLAAFELRGADVRDDLARTGRVVRRTVRAVSNAVTDATSDARITTTIKAKLVADRELSAWNIAVSTTDGRVTLSGSVATEEQIGRAVLLALEVSGVREVMSTIQVKR